MAQDSWYRYQERALKAAMPLPSPIVILTQDRLAAYRAALDAAEAVVLSLAADEFSHPSDSCETCYNFQEISVFDECTFYHEASCPIGILALAVGEARRQDG